MRNYILPVTILLTAALSAAGCSKKHEAGRAETAPAAVVKGASLEVVKLVAVPELLDVVGSVRARTSAVVSTRIPGSISVLRVREGDRVRKGQLLAQLAYARLLLSWGWQRQGRTHEIRMTWQF